ncbi:hypothetical protein DFH09DRAFT_1089565 [Mycena vulgaris]|nr:hypothetical protein DFH09DRAFT_1089565 [Mycena vulgaris]
MIRRIGPGSHSSEDHSEQCITRRLRPVKAPGGLVGFSLFRNSAFSVLCACAFTTFLGLFTMLTYITSSAFTFRISPNFAFYLVAVNFSAGVGRVACGILGDRFGEYSLPNSFRFIAD